MAFVQIIDFRTSRFDEMRKLEDEWEVAAGPGSTALRLITGADRDNAGRYLQIVFSIPTSRPWRTPTCRSPRSSPRR
jgi:hypothetical protein